MKILKRISIVLAVILVISAASITAFAAGGLLKIANDKPYGDMAKSYQDGYSPVQSGDSVNVILPLTFAGNPSDINLVITPNLGDTTTAPFVFNNYQQTGTLNAANPVYVAQFAFALKKDRISGSYPIVFNVSYADAGETVEQPFTVYATVDGASPTATATAEAPRPQPKLIVSHYGTSPDVIKAGETFAVKATLENTSTKYDVKNITVTYAGDGKSLLSADNTNTVYIDKIKREESADVTFNMQARLDCEPGIQTVTLNIEYEDSKATGYTVTEPLLLQVTQNVNLEYDEPQIPQTANAGDTLPLSFNVFNKGRSKLYNVMVKIEAPGLLPEGSAFVGNMEPGTSGTAELYVFVGTLGMSQNEEGNMQTDNDAEKYGYTNGKITISYEDEFGNPSSQEIQVGMNIEPPVISANADQEEEEPVDTVSQWWISVLVGAVLIAAVAAVLVVRRKRKIKALGDGDGLD